MILLFIFITITQIQYMDSLNNDNQLTKYKNIIKSFKPSVYQPLSFYERNCHWQTIIYTLNRLFMYWRETFLPANNIHAKNLETYRNTFYHAHSNQCRIFHFSTRPTI